MPEAVQEIDFEQKAVVVADQPASVPAVATTETGAIFQLIERAARDPSVDIDKMERLIAMQERVQAEQARREFDNAMASAQEEMRAIRADLSNNQTKSNYASYAQLDKAIRPIYSRHGFAVTFNTGDAPKADDLRVLATVAHRGGHRQDYRIDMPADGKGAKGADVMTRTHATGAAASYGQRYLYKLIFNLAVGDVDDDGNGASAGDSDIENLAPANALRDPQTGKLLSTYSADRANKARDWADNAIECINLAGNPLAVKEWRRIAANVPQGKRKSPLDWLKDNSPGQYLRVRQAYQNATGEDLE